ncbi:MAG: PorT family protein [Bacteroidales bacterium]|nr:PorT family protein [Bacteroidales bacterium]
MIKRLSILSLCLAALCLPMRAEKHYKPHISIGAHAGTDMSKMSFSPSVKQKFESGLCGGISIRYAEERLVGILAELNFVQRGWKEDFEDSPLAYSRKLNYFELPIMTHIYFGPPRFKCFFNLGPEFCYMISESTKANFDYHNPTEAEGWPTKSRMTEQLVDPVKNKFDYGICAGFGCEFFLTPRNSAYIEGRYYYGLGNIFPSTKADTFSASRNMTISITLGYHFRIK